MKRLLGTSLLALAAGFAACTSPFPHEGNGGPIVVTIDPSTPRGSGTARQQLSLTVPVPFKVSLEVRRRDGTRDTDFNGYLRASVKPGAVVGVQGAGASGRNVKVNAGVAEGIQVQVLGAFGDTRLWFEDIGYTPADPTRDPPPQCSNGVDDDGDGTIDFPADPGCAFANDDTERDGSYATGTSDVIYFAYPRVSDVRGAASGGNATPFPHDQVFIDAGWDGQKVNHSLVVTRIASDGFYVTDLEEDRNPKVGYSSVFAFNFNPPAGLRVCDRLRALAGTMVDFFGFTEINYPTWQVEAWDPTQRPCLVPDPKVLTPADLGSQPALFATLAGLVRLETSGTLKVHVGSKLGPGNPDGPAYLPDTTKTNCDINKDGKVDFYTDPEKTCADNCDKDPECTEYTNYAGRQAFQLVVEDTAAQQQRKIQANAGSDALFDPVALRGQPVRAFTGTLRYFSGGSQFTVEARCAADIVVPLDAQPAPSDKACVFPRTASENNEASH